MSEDWYPQINTENCTECGECVSFCTHGVYDKSSTQKPIVLQPEGCIDKCHGCGDRCSAGAITYHGDDTGWLPPHSKASLQADCGCGCDSSCDDKAAQGERPEKKLDIDFLYLDLSTCERCQATDSSLKEALSTLSDVFDAQGFTVKVNKVNITSRELAEKYRFVSSPTIRVNGVDINTEVKESDCTDCGSLCGDSVDCRVFTYEGKDYEEPPAAMIVDGILKAMYVNQVRDETPYTLPQNLDKFFSGVEGVSSSESCGCQSCDTQEGSQKKTLTIYEPAMCCPTGLCGVELNTELLRVSAAIESLKTCEADIEINRFNLTNAPEEFVKNVDVNSRLADEGVEVLPIVIVDGKIVITKRYPRNDEFERLLGITCECLHGNCSDNEGSVLDCGCEDADKGASGSADKDSKDEKGKTEDSCSCGCEEGC